jgi:hypothetical protein
MYSKTYNWTKAFISKALPKLVGLVVFMTFIDFLLKWQIYSYIFATVSTLSSLLYRFAFETFVLICLLLLALSLWIFYKKFVNSKPNALEKQVLDIKTSLEAQLKKISDSSVTKIKDVETIFNNKIFEIERALVEFEIEKHRSKGQVGEVSMMIKKLRMDIKRKWGAEDTLLEIKGYIKKNGMPNYYINDLHEAIKVVPDSVKIVGDEIIKLAQENLYNPNE